MAPASPPPPIKSDRPGRITSARPISITPADEEEFRLAMADYQKRSGRMFPTWTEILEVILAIGYAKRVWRPIPPESR